MRIYRFAPDTGTYGHPRRSVVGRWWPEGIDLGSWMDYVHDLSKWEVRPHAGGRYRPSPEESPLSDFPLLSLQVPVVSEHAAESLGFHPDRPGDHPELAARLRPIWIGDQRFFAVQPLFSVRGEPNAFVAEESAGIRLSGGEVIHYHTRMFDPSRLKGEFFAIPPHEPYADVYVTEALVDRARDARLSGIDGLELVFDGAPVPTHHQPPATGELGEPSFRQQLEWELFKGRGDMLHYSREELQNVFRAAVVAGWMPV